MADYIAFGDPNEKPIAGLVQPTGAQLPTVYPSKRTSLFSMVGDYTRSNPKTGLGDASFWQRTVTSALLLTFVTYIVGFATNLSLVVVLEETALNPGVSNQLSYALIAGIAVALQLVFTNAAGARVGGLLQLFEIWMEHYEHYINGVGYRILYWFIMLAADILGWILAAWTVWGLQVDNSVTHAGLPVVAPGLSVWWAAALQLIGSAAIYWMYYHAIYDPETSSDVNRSNAPWLIGFTVFAFTYITFPYTQGGFNFERFIGTAIISGFWPENCWVYAAGPLVAGAVISVLWYFVWRTTSETVSMKSE